MAAPAGVTPYTKGVIIEMDDLSIVPQQNTSVFGTIVTLGATATTYSLTDIVSMKNFYIFSQSGTSYAIADEQDVLFVYVPV